MLSVSFHNILVAMRLKSTTSDLPSSYDVMVFLHNAFVKRISDLKESIMVSKLLFHKDRIGS